MKKSQKTTKKCCGEWSGLFSRSRVEDRAKRLASNAVRSVASSRGQFTIGRAKVPRRRCTTRGLRSASSAHFSEPTSERTRKEKTPLRLPGALFSDVGDSSHRGISPRSLCVPHPGRNYPSVADSISPDRTRLTEQRTKCLRQRRRWCRTFFRAPSTAQPFGSLRRVPSGIPRRDRSPTHPARSPNRSKK